MPRVFLLGKKTKKAQAVAPPQDLETDVDTSSSAAFSAPSTPPGVDMSAESDRFPRVSPPYTPTPPSLRPPGLLLPSSASAFSAVPRLGTAPPSPLELASPLLSPGLFLPAHYGALLAEGLRPSAPLPFFTHPSVSLAHLAARRGAGDGCGPQVDPSIPFDTYLQKMAASLSGSSRRREGEADLSARDSSNSPSKCPAVPTLKLSQRDVQEEDDSCSSNSCISRGSQEKTSQEDFSARLRKVGSEDSSPGRSSDLSSSLSPPEKRFSEPLASPFPRSPMALGLPPASPHLKPFPPPAQRRFELGDPMVRELRGGQERGLGGGVGGGLGGLGGLGYYPPAFLPLGALGLRRPSSDKPPPVKKYKCDVCGKAFSRSNTLVTHKRIHTGDKPFKCEACGRAFRQPGNLTRHRLTHTTHKPYVCPTCNKAFNRASNLHTHMRTHSAFRPFVCSICHMSFPQKIDLKIHLYTHTGEKPHKCDDCGKGFTVASTLNAHRRSHHPLPTSFHPEQDG